MAESSRLDELRRRVQQDPASIAFAALAEEYRRARRFRDAVDTSRAGLRHHPTYFSARVTLGRCLMELQDYEPAERELAHVLRHAPENLAAHRALGELCWQQLRFKDALQHFRNALALVPRDTELPAIVRALEDEIAAEERDAHDEQPEPEIAAEPAALVVATTEAVAEAEPVGVTESAAVAEAAQTEAAHVEAADVEAFAFTAVVAETETVSVAEAPTDVQVMAVVEAAAETEAIAVVDATEEAEAVVVEAVTETEGATEAQPLVVVEDVAETEAAAEAEAVVVEVVAGSEAIARPEAVATAGALAESPADVAVADVAAGVLAGAAPSTTVEDVAQTRGEVAAPVELPALPAFPEPAEIQPEGPTPTPEAFAAAAEAMPAASHEDDAPVEFELVGEPVAGDFQMDQGLIAAVAVIQDAEAREWARRLSALERLHASLRSEQARRHHERVPLRARTA